MCLRVSSNKGMTMIVHDFKEKVGILECDASNTDDI